MAFDEHLADRIRELLAPEPGLTEQRMFGGLAFLLDGKMAVAVSGQGGQGGVMVRIDPAEGDRLVARNGARRLEMNGRPMRAWLVIDSAHVRTARQLSTWVRTGVTTARSLPPTAERRPRASSD